MAEAQESQVIKLKINGKSLEEIAHGIIVVSLPAGDIETTTTRGQQRTAKSVRLQMRIVEALEKAYRAGRESVQA